MSVSSFLGGLANPDGKFNKVMTRVFNVLLLNGLFLVTYIPVVTGGASATALYYAMSKAVYHDRGQISREFFRSWRREMRQGICLQLIFLAVAAVAIFDIYYAYAMAATQAMNVVCLLFGFTTLFLLLPIYLYVYPLLSRVEGSVGGYLSMAAKLAAQHLLPTIPLLFLMVVLTVLTVLMPPLILVMPGLFSYISCPFINRVLQKHLDYSQPLQTGEDAWYRE